MNQTGSAGHPESRPPVRQQSPPRELWQLGMGVQVDLGCVVLRQAGRDADGPTRGEQNWCEEAVRSRAIGSKFSFTRCYSGLDEVRSNSVHAAHASEFCEPARAVGQPSNAA